MTVDERAKAIDRVRKLRALADPDRGGTENERAVAATKALAVMERFTITEEDLREQPSFEDLFRNFWTAGPTGSGARYTYLWSATDVAFRAGIDAARFRRWLRRRGLTGAERDKVLGDPAQRDELVERYKRWERSTAWRRRA